MSGRDLLVRLLSVILLIGLNAFFVAAEFSIVSVRRSRISQLVLSGDLQAQSVQSLQRSIDRLLSTTQLGITLSSLALGWIGESTMAVALKRAILALPIPETIAKSFAHSLAIPVAFLLIAYLQIVLGELCPKSIALTYSEQLARFFAFPSLTIGKLFNPFIWILNASNRQLLNLLGIVKIGQENYDRVTSEELQLIIATEKESSGLEAGERELLNNVFEFGEVLVAEVMVPRTSTTYIERNATLGDLMELVETTGHYRYPVMDESFDDIVGIVNFKNIGLLLAKGQVNAENAIEPWIETVKFIPETTRLKQLLPQMQRSRLKMVVVVDEFGGNSGIVTIQDLVAQIIGEESQDRDRQDPPIQIIDSQTSLVQAQIDLEEVNKILDLNLPVADEYQTLAGFILYQFQKIPTQGETLEYEDLEITITAAEGPKLSEIRIFKKEIISLPIRDLD
jgi:CBS domain containing-hemolysin-like protein